MVVIEQSPSEQVLSTSGSLLLFPGATQRNAPQTVSRAAVSAQPVLQARRLFGR